MVAVQAEAGPSTPRKSKQINFDSSDSEAEADEGTSAVGTPLSSKKRKRFEVNGSASTSSTPNGSRLKGLKGKKKVDNDTAAAREARRARAAQLLEKRRELPFYRGREMILKEIMDHETTILLGETGCGKSTQLPQLLRTHPLALDHYSPLSAAPLSRPEGKALTRFQRGPSIAITQPRRLPAIALANRVAEEMGCRVGGEVGYSVRFEEALSASTRLRFLTEGVLMRELASASRDKRGAEEREDEGLNLLLQYDIVIIDEAHERTLNTDFLCGALKRIQRIRKGLVARQAAANGHVPPSSSRVKELKLVIMSATLDPSKFQKFFDTGRDALIVKGRVFDVSTRHATSPIDDFVEGAARQVMHIHCAKPAQEGDVLVFMPGAEEIENCVDLLRRVSKQLPHNAMQLHILPLYSALPPSAQAKIFAPPSPNARRVIVATNIAETSMTIPGVAFVIDTGFKKEKEYIFRNSGSLEALKKRNVSKAAAWQRTGRAGRERAGQCFRLFTKPAFDKLEDFDQPEIQRCNLASAVLQLVAMRLDPFTFEYIDNPGRDPIAAAFQTLGGLGALSGPTTITPLGLDMLRYPLDPGHARILVASFEMGCASEIIDVLSLVVSGPIWVDRANDRESAAASRAKFIHRDGDHLTALNVFRAYLALKEQRRSGQGSGESLPTWCRENHVNGKTLAAALKVRDQLRELAARNGKDPNASCGSDTQLVMRALLQGLFMNTAVVQPDGSYRQTAGNLQVKIHPSSVLMSKKVPAIVYDELAITSSIYARNVSSFEQGWLLDIPLFQRAGMTLRAPPEKGSL